MWLAPALEWARVTVAQWMRLTGFGSDLMMALHFLIHLHRKQHTNRCAGNGAGDGVFQTPDCQGR
jgi:hypothetical protein